MPAALTYNLDNNNPEQCTGFEWSDDSHDANYLFCPSYCSALSRSGMNSVSGRQEGLNNQGVNVFEEHKEHCVLRGGNTESAIRQTS